MFEKHGHHIIHHKAEWSLRPEAKAIRETPSLIVPMERSLHNEIHSNVPAVPLLGYHALMRTSSNFEPIRGDSLKTIENLMAAIETSASHPKAHVIEKHLADLAIWAIDLQRPFIGEAVQRRRFIA